MIESEGMSEKKDGYKKTRLGLIPKEWEYKKIRNVSDYVDYRGKTPAKTEGGIFLVTASNIKDGYIDYKCSQEYVGAEEYDEVMSRGLPKEGDVLITTEAPLGSVAQIDNERVALAQRVIKYRFDEVKILNDFAKHIFLSYGFQKELFREATGSTVLGIKGSRLHNISIPIPTKKEQKIIVEVLLSWDEAISKTEKLIKAKKRYKKGLMQRLLSGKVRFPECEGEWVEARFKDVVKIDAKSLSSKTSPNYSFQYISLSDIKSGIISKDLEVHDYKNAPSRAKRIVSEGDILMATVRPNLQAFAMAKKEHQDLIASTGFAVLSPKNNFNIKYLYHYLYSDHISSQLHALTVGSNYPAINSSDVKNMKINIPTDEEEVDKIESVFTTIDKEIKRLEKIKGLFVIQKKGLMQKLLTGKVRVNKLEGV